MATASELKHGDRFKWNRGQRKWREVANVLLLEPGKFIGPEDYTGKLVVTMKYTCGQVLLSPTDNVLICDEPKL